MENNKLTRFDVTNQTHEESKLGGIPQGINSDGKMNTVETGETKYKNYIYSNRLYINEDLVKQFNLPNSIKGKTFADASKIIEKPFKDRNSNPDKATLKEHLNRLQQAQETLKAEEQQKQEAFAKNLLQNQVSNNQEIPQGMEEYIEPQDNIQEEVQEQSQASAYGGFIKRYDKGGNLLQNDQLKQLGESGATGLVGGALTGGFNGALKGGLAAGANVLLPGSGQFVAPIIDTISGLLKKPDTSILNKNAITANSQFSDKFDEGGPLDFKSPIYNQKQDTFPYGQFRYDETIKPGGIEINDLSKKNGYSNPEYAPNKNTTNLGKNPNRLTFGKITNSIGDYLDKNGGKMLKYAPVAMNAYQLSQLKKPTGVVLDKLSNKYTPTYMDETTLRNIANNETNNTIAALTNATAGSESALRANLVGANIGRIKGLSDSYTKMREYNASQNATKQQFDLGVDQFNIGQSNNQLDINDRNQANYRNQKSKLLGAIGTDLGEIGKEEINKNAIATALGYDTYGNYVVNKKTGEKMLATDFHEKVKNGTLGKKYNFNSDNNFKPISYSPNMNFNKLGR